MDSKDQTAQTPDQSKRRQITPERWQEIQAELLAISQQGRQDVDLAEFIARDRETH
jgi:hypothetical protein